MSQQVISDEDGERFRECLDRMSPEVRDAVAGCMFVMGDLADQDRRMVVAMLMVLVKGLLPLEAERLQ
jgi:hypothetical protein